MKTKIIGVSVFAVVVVIIIIATTLSIPNANQVVTATVKEARITDTKNYYSDISIDVKAENLTGTWTSFRGEENLTQEFILNADQTYVVKWQGVDAVSETGTYTLKDKTVTITNDAGAITYDVFIQEGNDGVTPEEQSGVKTKYFLYLNVPDTGNVFYFGERNI